MAERLEKRVERPEVGCGERTFPRCRVRKENWRAMMQRDGGA